VGFFRGSDPWQRDLCAGLTPRPCDGGKSAENL